MRKGQKLETNNGVQVALFPLYSFRITQRDTDTFSHDPKRYLATDYQAFTYTSGNDHTIGTGYALTKAPYYAPCDMECVGMDKTNASILWRSREKVLLANGDIDYLIILFYHDDGVPNGSYTIGEKIDQGETIGHTGTSGNVTGDHVHIETGYGENWNKVYANPSWGHINLEYALHNYDALWGNDTICYGTSNYPYKYPFEDYEGGDIPPKPKDYKRKNFPWVLYARKLHDKRS